MISVFSSARGTEVTAPTYQELKKSTGQGRVNSNRGENLMPIKLDDPNALEQLTEKLSKRRQLQEMMKEVNAHV